MPRVLDIDHLVISVSDCERSKPFYGRLFGFLGMQVSNEYDKAIGWKTEKLGFWIFAAARMSTSCRPSCCRTA